MSSIASIDEARAYFEGDRFAVNAGISIDEVAPGYAVCHFDITPDHRNAENGVMGGAIFTLVDLAFAAAANGIHLPTVAQQVSMNFLSGSRGTTLTATARWAVRIYMSGMAVFWLQIACQQAFVALGQAKASLFFALFRKVILLIPLIFILPHMFADQVLGVLIAEPIADVVSALTCGAVFFWRLPKIIKKRQEVLSHQ